MLGRAVIQHQVDDDADAAAMRLRHELLEVFVGPVVTVYSVIVADIIPMVAGRLSDRHEPDAVRPEVALRRCVAIVDVVELLDQTLEVAYAIPITIEKRTNEHFVADRGLPPMWGATFLGVLSAKVRSTQSGQDGYGGSEADHYAPRKAVSESALTLPIVVVRGPAVVLGEAADSESIKTNGAQ